MYCTKTYPNCCSYVEISGYTIPISNTITVCVDSYVFYRLRWPNCSILVTICDSQGWITADKKRHHCTAIEWRQRNFPGYAVCRQRYSPRISISFLFCMYSFERVLTRVWRRCIVIRIQTSTKSIFSTCPVWSYVIYKCWLACVKNS